MRAHWATLEFYRDSTTAKSEFYFRREFLEGRCREPRQERRILPEIVKSTWFDLRFTQNLQKEFDTRTRSNSVRQPPPRTEARTSNSTGNSQINLVRPEVHPELLEEVRQVELQFDHPVFPAQRVHSSFGVRCNPWLNRTRDPLWEIPPPLT